MTQSELENIFNQSIIERQERLDALNEYESTEEEYERKILDIMKIHQLNVVSLKVFGKENNLDLSILDLQTIRVDLNKLTMIELQTALSNVAYDITALELSDAQDTKYYNMTLNEAFESLQKENNN